MKLKQFKHELRGNYNCDKWGEVMGAWFECAAHLWVRGEDVPYHWQYRPGATNNPTDKESYYYSIFKKCSNRQLLIIGNFLERLSNFLKRGGLDY